MPSESKEPVALYIAKSMQELNEKVNLKVDKGASLKAYCTTAAKMFKSGKEAYLKKDEERAYVLYMKFANLAQQIRKLKGYNAGDKEYFNSLMGYSNLLPAVDKAEELAESLSNRYSELKEAEEYKAKLDQRDKEAEETKSKAKDGSVVNGINGQEKSAEEEIGKDGSISAEELYRLFNNKDLSVLVLDARSDQDFDESHIICEKCANIPESSIKPGCTVAIVQKGLDSSAKHLFSQRGLADYIVMLDWDSSVADLTQHSTLWSLKDAIYKWDSTMTLKHEPLVLAGGYERWLLKYPMYSTNPKVTKPNKGKAVNKYASLDHFDYPTSLEDEEPEKPPAPKQAQAPIQAPQQNGPVAQGVAPGAQGVAVARKPLPVIQRHLKPGAPIVPSQGGGIANGAADPQQMGVINPAMVTQSGGAPIVGQPQPPTATGDAKSSTDIPIVAASGAAPAAVPRPGLPDRSSKPQGRVTVKSEPIPSSLDDELPPSYDDVQEKEKDDAEQEQLMQEHKNKENQARLELERMRHGKAKAENEQLKKEKEEMEKKLEEKIAALQTLQKQLQEQQAKQEEEKKLAEEKAKAEEEKRKAAEVAAAGESAAAAESASAAGAGSVQNNTGQDASKSQPSTKSTPQPSPAKDIPTKPAQTTTTQPQPKPQQPPQQQSKQAAPTSTKTLLPPGWEKNIDARSGRYFYIDHNRGKTQWAPPTVVGPSGAGAAAAGVARPSAASSPKASPQHLVRPDSPALKPTKASTSADSITTSKARLKSSSDAEFSSKPGLKRSFSSPNIAKMVMEEEDRPTVIAPLAPRPSFDRSTKPSERLTNIQQQIRPVTVSRMRNLAPVYGSMGRGRTGLKNLGNTCFMNSVVQCLSATTLLSGYFIDDLYLRHINRRNPLGRGGEVVEEFAVVIKALWSGQYRSISPRDLRDTVYKYVPEFRKHMGHHHDSQEFLLFLMDGLHEDINQVVKREYVEEPDYAKMPDDQGSQIAWDNHKRFNQSIIVELFQGQFKSTVRCLTCQHKSIKFDAFTFLTLPIPSSGRVQLKECLANFSKPEKMTGDNAIYCSRCKTKRNSEKNIHLWKLPPVLLICLKRFYHEGMWRQKLQTMVDYPLQDMEMAPFTIGPRRKGLYNLYAVSNHTGTLDGGHYTAYCKNPMTKRWFKYDDHEVYDVSAGNIKSSAAYILFYSSIELPPP